MRRRGLSSLSGRGHSSAVGKFRESHANARDDAEFAAVCLYIWEHREWERFFRAIRRYLYVDDWKYWTMSTEVTTVTLINRERLRDAEGRPLKSALRPLPSTEVDELLERLRAEMVRERQ